MATNLAPSNLTVLNFPTTTPEAQKFWASKHKCNKAKAIMAFSKDLRNANWNLIQYGYTNSWRSKIFAHYGKYVNQPSMVGIPFTPLSIPWWECLGEVPGDFIPLPNVPIPSAAYWNDLARWIEANKVGQQPKP